MNASSMSGVWPTVIVQGAEAVRGSGFGVRCFMHGHSAFRIPHSAFGSGPFFVVELLSGHPEALQVRADGLHHLQPAAEVDFLVGVVGDVLLEELRSEE